MNCQRNVNSILSTQLPHAFSYIVAILIHNHFELSNTSTLRGICKLKKYFSKLKETLGSRFRFLLIQFTSFRKIILVTQLKHNKSDDKCDAKFDIINIERIGTFLLMDDTAE
jgi:hypothetical protein